MTQILSQLPPWVQELITWLFTGTNLISLAGVVTTLFKVGGMQSQNKALSGTQIELLQTMTAKLADTRNLADAVNAVLEQSKSALLSIKTAMEEQRLANANLAMFVMECFNKSNLTDEAKSELRVMADKIFFNDNTKALQALEEANVAATAELAEAKAKITELEEQVKTEHDKLVVAQENVKSSRRIQ